LPENIEHIESLISQGRYIEARLKSEEALKVNQELRYKQLYALAVSKSGMPETALAFMEPVFHQFPNDPESAGILGSIYKELFKKNQINSFAVKSRDTYFQNFSITKSYYTGINAAAMAAMAGQASRSREIANEVITLIDTSAENDFWKLATLGEAYVLTKNRAKSIEYFVEARKLAGSDWGKITSVYNQLWLLNHFVPVSGEVLKMFIPPTVVAFIGHMIDHPNRSTPRFPAEIELQVKNAILNSLRTSNARIGYCSLACGGDILFAEAMEELGGEINIFLPFSEDDFIKQSVRFAGEDWVSRYNRLIKKFPVTYITHEAYEGLDDLFSFQNKVICGSAVLRSTAHHAEPTLLTVLSGVDLKRKQGGTRDTLNIWPYPKNYININPDSFLTTQPVPQPEAAAQRAVEKIDRPVLFLVHVNTESLPAMVLTKLLKDIDAKILSEVISFTSYKAEPTSLLAGFDMESAAMEFVTLITDSLKNNSQAASVKISLNAGPVFVEADNNSIYKNITGESVLFVKNMDALATTSAVLASDHVAAVLALGIKKYALDYSGVLPLENGKSRNVYTVKFSVR
jgi:tetratricopeptide (TPR) repeat protein